MITYADPPRHVFRVYLKHGISPRHRFSLLRQDFKLCFASVDLALTVTSKSEHHFGRYRLQPLALARMGGGSKFEWAPSFCPNISRKKATDRDETFNTLASINFTSTLKIPTP